MNKFHIHIHIHIHMHIPPVGDSSYRTYLVNPTTIDKGLTAAGASRIGDMAKADAKQIGDNSQENVIAKWKEEMWIPIAKALSSSDDSDPSNKSSDSEDADAAVTGPINDVKKMQAGAIPILMKLDPEYNPPKELGERASGGIPMHLVVAVIVALIAALFVTGTIQAP